MIYFLQTRSGMSPNAGAVLSSQGGRRHEQVSGNAGKVSCVVGASGLSCRVVDIRVAIEPAVGGSIGNGANPERAVRARDFLQGNVSG